MILIIEIIWTQSQMRDMGDAHRSVLDAVNMFVAAVKLL